MLLALILFITPVSMDVLGEASNRIDMVLDIGVSSTAPIEEDLKYIKALLDTQLINLNDKTLNDARVKAIFALYYLILEEVDMYNSTKDRVYLKSAIRNKLYADSILNNLQTKP